MLEGACPCVCRLAGEALSPPCLWSIRALRCVPPSSHPICHVNMARVFSPLISRQEWPLLIISGTFPLLFALALSIVSNRKCHSLTRCASLSISVFAHHFQPLPVGLSCTRRCPPREGGGLSYSRRCPPTWEGRAGRRGRPDVRRSSHSSVRCSTGGLVRELVQKTEMYFKGNKGEILENVFFKIKKEKKEPEQRERQIRTESCIQRKVRGKLQCTFPD